MLILETMMGNKTGMIGTLFALPVLNSGFELVDVRLLLMFVVHSVFSASVSTIVAKSLVTVASGRGCSTTDNSPVELAPPSLVTATTASARATDNTLSAIDSAACCKSNESFSFSFGCRVAVVQYKFTNTMTNINENEPKKKTEEDNNEYDIGCRNNNLL